MSIGRTVVLIVLGTTWLVLVLLLLRFQSKAWRHRTPAGRERLRWDRPKFTWFLIPDPGSRSDFDEQGWHYRAVALWCMAGAVAVMITAWVVSW